MMRDWNEFWFSQKSPGPLGLYRVLSGACFFLWGVLLAPPNLDIWFTERGPMPISAYEIYKGTTLEISLFGSITDPNVWLVIWIVYLVVAFLFTIGLGTRTSGVLLLLIFLSICNRDQLIMNGSDMAMRCFLFLLVIAPCGKSCSVDRLIAIGRGIDPGGDPAPVEQWAQRLLQIQVSLVYGATVASKLGGDDWLNGTAIYFPLHMPELARFPVPSFFSNGLVINALTWGTLAIETSLATFVWFRRTRPYVLAAGVLLHCGIEYALNVPMFSLVMTTSFMNFVYNEWIVIWVDALSSSFSRFRVLVRLPTGVTNENRWWLVVERLDFLKLIRLDNGAAPELTVTGRGWSTVGASAMQRIVFRFPVLWPISPLFLLPGSTRLFAQLLPHPIPPTLAPDRATAHSH